MVWGHDPHLLVVRAISYCHNPHPLVGRITAWSHDTQFFVGGETAWWNYAIPSFGELLPGAPSPILLLEALIPIPLVV